MKTPLIQLLALLALAGVGSAQAQSAQSIQSIQSGLWELSHDMRMPGQPDMNAQMAQMREQLKNLPPETRKMMEQQMAGSGVAFGEGGAMRVCVSPEDAKAGAIREGQTQGDCTYSQIKRSGNTWRGHVVCQKGESQGDFTTTIHSPTRFSTVANVTSKQGRMDMRTESRFIGSDCGALGKPSAKRR